MSAISRQAAATALAVMILSAFPLAQGPEPLSRPGLPAAGAPVAAPAAPAPVQAANPADADQTRTRLLEMLNRHPPSLGDVLRLDPTLLTNTDYLAPYPELAAFLAQHPEVAHNPGYYVGTAHESPWDRNPQVTALRMWENVMQGLMVMTVLLLVTGVLVWLVRTMMDYRRWIRLTRVQTETHTKLLDRLTTQEDLLAYMQTAAGRRFLESAPITLDPASRPLGAPLNRVLWSVQAGVVLALGGIGLLFISRRVIPDIAQGLSGDRHPRPGARRRVHPVVGNRVSALEPSRSVRSAGIERRRRARERGLAVGARLIHARAVMRPGLASMHAAVPVIADAAPVMDEDAFRAFYDRTARPAWAYLYRATGDAALADDLLQETYYRLLRGRAVFDSEEHRVHYLFRIAANLLADTHRRRPPEHVALSEEVRREDAGPDPARAIEQQTDVARALATLAPRDRDMLWLAYADGASHAEIASQLGVARPSVKTMLFRARRRLAARLHRVNAAFGGRGR